MQCPLCAPPVVNGTPTQVAFGNLNGGQTGTVTFQAKANAPAPQPYLNIDKGRFTPPPGNWYDQNLFPEGFFNFGVFEMRKVSITKQVVSTVGQTFPAGPFLINVNCTLPSLSNPLVGPTATP